MTALQKRLGRERATIKKMVAIYCHAHHGDRNDALCDSCQDFMDYAATRLRKCPYGDTKPTCANCPVHCYKPARREQAKSIMRFAGPRMLLRHPLLTIAHQLDGFRKVEHPATLTREQRISSRKK